MNAQNLQDLFGVGKKPGSHEHQAQGDLRLGQLAPQTFGPFLEFALLEIAGPMGCDGKLIAHI